MPVAPSVFSQLTRIYTEREKAEDDSAFLVGRKRQIKVLVDTIWEQVTESIFGTKPRNVLDARRVINDKGDEIVSLEERQIVDALKEVLRVYDGLVDPGYIDVPKKVGAVLVHLRRLCIVLTLHGSFRADPQARKLRTLLTAK